MLFDEFAPIGEHIIIVVDIRNERLNQILLASQLRARVNSAADIDNNFLVLAVAVLIFLHEHKNIIYVDIDLFYQLDLKDDIFGDILLVTVLFILPFVAQILIPSEIGLQVALGDKLSACKFIKRQQQIAHTR